MNKNKRANGPWSKIVLDEIALEGLEGISIEGLWIRFEQALNLPNKTPQHFKILIWEFIKNQGSNLLEFFEIPQPKERLKTVQRSQFIDPESGFITLPDECPFTKYNYKAISEFSVRGSCEYYYKRKKIPVEEIENMSLEELNEKFGEKFVIVASQDYRENVLFPENTEKINDFTNVQYCVFEAIGRSRYNGEVTAGKHSLHTYVTDYLDTFYIKSKLMSLQLIVKQPYIERTQGRISNGYILTLPRFYKVYKTRPIFLIESLYDILSMIPKKTLEVQTLKKTHPFEGVSLKKLTKIPIFSKHFELTRIPYREIYPYAEVEEWRNFKMQEKHLFVIRFKNPNVTLEDIFDSTKIENSECENIEFLSEKHYFLDMPFQEQVYRFIAKHGSVGCNQRQMTRYMAISKYSVRQLVNRFLKMGYIKEFPIDVGRQRVLMYVTTDNLKNTNNSKVPSPQEILDESDDEKILKLMQETDIFDELKPEDKPDGLKIDKISQVEAQLKENQLPYNFEENKILLKKIETPRHSQRIKLILDFLKKKFIAEKNFLRKHIMTEEEKLGFKDQICSKSLYRITKLLIEKKLIRFFELTLKYKKYVKKIHYLTHKKLEIDFKVFQNEVLKQKYALIVLLEERQVREQTKANEQPSTSSTTLIPYKTVRETFAKSPKFLTARFIHEYIYFLVYEQNRDSVPIKEYDRIESLLMESAPNYDLDNLEDDLSVGCYDNNLSWKMFIQPLPVYKDKPNGWAYIMDIYLRLPLSVIIKLYQINKYCHPLFTEYVNNPIKQHYLVHKLPTELQEILSHFRVSQTIIIVLKIINWIGLVQMGNRVLRDPRECWIYINRKAKILDTTISSPRYRYISTDKTYNEMKFTFNTSQDVQNYWNTLFKICLSTKLGAKNDLLRGNAGRQDRDFLAPVNFNEAMENDVGYIPGDGLGASGIDSSQFSHLQRNWTWRAAVKKKPQIKISKTNKIRFSAQTAKMAIEKPIKFKINQNSVKLKSIKKITLKKSKPLKQVTKKKTEYDKVDKEALNKMSSLRVSWSLEEDRMLKICRSVYIYLSGSISQLQRAINSYIYRDILHWALNSVNKTSRACQRRLRYMMRNRPSPDVMTWVHELKQNLQISHYFGVNVLMNLRVLYKNDAEFINILKILFIKLVYYLNKNTQNTNEKKRRTRTLLPDTLNQFYNLYKETQTLNPSNDIAQIREFTLKHIDPQNIEDIEISTINSIMHSTLCCTRDKTLYNIQIFEVYKKYKEEILAKAYKKARDDNLVVQLKFKSGASGSKLAPISGSSLVLSVKYKQQLFLDIPYEAIELCFKQFELSLQNFFNTTQTPLLLKTVDAGGFYHLLEMMANDHINIDIQLPQKILTVDPNHSTSCEDETERIMDHFHLILDNAPKNEYIKYFEEDNQNIVPRIKFHKTNENYKLIYNPYDILSKLPDDYYHFYCALDSINKTIDLDFTRFNMDTFCPFNCILKFPDLINTIERIINTRKTVIEDLIHNSEIEEIIESIVNLNQKNLMQAFERLQKALRERNLGNDLKDFGKLKIERNRVDILTLSKDILDYTDVDFDNKLEFESSINKEDKNKSQDVYVVNLPTLKVTYKNKEIESETEEYVMYKNLPIPKHIVKNAIYREEVLKKILAFSYWCHNGNVKKFMQSTMFMKLSYYEQTFTEILLNYLAKFELGVTAEVLLKQFNDEKLLEKICSILRKNFLIMRVGIENFIYVHKIHITPWVVNSYNIKRLDKESLQDSKVIISVNPKATKRPSDTKEIDEPLPKKEAIDKGDGKRISKPRQQYQVCNTSAVKTKEHFVKEKENIIIRPFPWIRINGSLNRRVLDKWIGVILTDCLLNSGQTVTCICQRFNQLHPMNLRCLLEILQELDCIKLKVLKKPTNITLFSNYEDAIEDEKDATEFSKMDETFILSLPNAMLNLSIFIGEKKYGMDFI